MKELSSFRLGGQNRDYLLVRVVARSHQHSADFWDGNWLDSRITIQVGAFTGDYRASLRSEEIARFLSSLRLVYTSLGTEIPTYVAQFSTMEEQLAIVIRGNALGHFVAECVAVDELGVGNRLEFELTFDQTYIPAVLAELEAILQAFPVTGNSGI